MPIETPRPDGSLGPLYLAGALEKVGIQADILDASVGSSEDDLNDTFYKSIMQPNGLTRIGMSQERITEFIAKGQYNVIGINSNFTPQTRMALEVARAVKNLNPDILVVAGGVNARNLPDRFLRDGLVDIICSTEGESIFFRIIDSWRNGLSFNDLDGVVYGRNGKYLIKPPKPSSITTNLDQLPIPSWEKLPFEKYEKIASPHGALAATNIRYAPIMTSRGCPFKCSYCHISMERDFPNDIGNLRLKSVDRVIEEMKVLKSLGVKKIFIEDDSLLAKKARVKQIFGKLLGMGFSIADVNGVNLVHFAIKGKGNKLEIDRDYFELLKSAGFDQIVFPVESASQRILDKYATGKLNHEKQDVVDLVKIARDVGIICPINMMIGFPDETENEMLQTIELGKKLVDAGADYCTFFIPIPFPGSHLYNIAIKDGYLNEDFDPDIMNWKNAVMKNTLVSPERIVQLRDWAWRTVNTQKHVERRLKESIGSRWNSNKDKK